MQRFIGCYMGCRLAPDLLLDHAIQRSTMGVSMGSEFFQRSRLCCHVVLLAEMLSILVFALEVMNDAPVNRCA